MIRLSSIFSFETLRLTPWFPKATLLALALLVGAEAAARDAVKRHRLHVDASGRQLIEDHRNAVAQSHADVWLLGNSTLGYGVDEKLLAARTGTRLLKLPHGSATVAATAKLLDYYLSIAKTHPPREVVVFVTEDDLNLHGYRASVSSEYDALCQDPIRKPQEYLTLWRARSHIAGRVEEAFDRFVSRGQSGKTKPAKEPNFDGKIAPDDEMYTRLLKNYEMDPSAIANVAETARKHGVSDVVLVLVPCTDVYAKFHDKLVPNQSYAALRGTIARDCARARIQFYDFGDPSSAYSEFYDGYHLNDAGAARFTAKLAGSHILVEPSNSALPSESAPSTPIDSASSNSPTRAQAGIED